MKTPLELAKQAEELLRKLQLSPEAEYRKELVLDNNGSSRLSIQDSNKICRPKLKF